MDAPRLAWARGAALAAALVLGCPAGLAQAGVFDQDALKRIDATDRRLADIQHDLDARLAAIEQQLKSQGLADLFNQVEQVKADVARLRGQLEVLANDIDQQQKRQRDLYVDLDTRLRKLETAPPPPAATDQPNTPAVAAPPAPGEQKAYDAALDQFKRADYAGAITSFGTFVRTYPQSPLAASAQYWIGNAQFAQKDYRGAIASQRQLVAAYPDSAKVPDALLTMASSQFELGDSAASRKTLEGLIAKYPQSEAAARARQRLAIR